jgi:hypothetical protein
VCTDEEFDEETTDRWLASPDRYPVLVPLPRVRRMFRDRGFEIVDEFVHPYGHGRSRYLVMRQGGSRSARGQ